MSRIAFLAAASALVLLSACDKGAKGTDITISGTDSEGKPATAKMDGATGRVTIDVPGVKVDVPLPRIELDSGNFDVGGVKLYPGSTVSGLNVLTDKKGDGSDGVKITFDAPADPATVSAWFAEKMRKQDFSVTADGTSLSGKTDDGDPFSLKLTPGAGGHSVGVFETRG